MRGLGLRRDKQCALKLLESRAKREQESVPRSQTGRTMLNPAGTASKVPSFPHVQLQIDPALDNYKKCVCKLRENRAKRRARSRTKVAN
jgi:hypothetical protein